jgi:hypothetical protein
VFKYFRNFANILTFGAAVFPAISITSTVALSQGSLRAQAVTIDTAMAINAPPSSFEPPASYDAGIPFGTVILLAGGDGLLATDSAGNITGPTGRFLIRAANEFMRRGLHVMIPDAAPYYTAAGGINFTDRLSRVDNVHATQMQGFINAAAARWQVPVWIVGNGNGALSAVMTAGYTPALTGYAGVLIGTPVTNFSTSNPANGPLFNLYASRINASPVLVYWHAADTCSFTPPAGTSALFQAIPSPAKQSASFTGGHSVAADPCNGLGEQSFAGIESTVVSAMANFILANSQSVKIPNQAAPAPKAPPLATAPPLVGWPGQTIRQ